MAQLGTASASRYDTFFLFHFHWQLLFGSILRAENIRTEFYLWRISFSLVLAILANL